jgi:hypothetical protein
MRKGIIAHDVRLTPENLQLLDGLTFVFVAIDKTGIKRRLFDYLIQHLIPFIDTGIGVSRHVDSLMATARITAATPEVNAHLSERVSMADDVEEQDDYQTNIQIAEINALCAAAAVIHWKRQFVFYENSDQAMHAQISVEGLKIFNCDDPA